MLDAIVKVVSIIGVITAVAGGALAIWKFYVFSEQTAKLTFNVDLIIRLEHQNYYICELIAEIANVGNVGVEIPAMKFVLYGLREQDSIDQKNKKILHQVTFPKFIKSGTWLEGSYVEPKSPQKYSHV